GTQSEIRTGCPAPSATDPKAVRRPESAVPAERSDRTAVPRYGGRLPDQNSISCLASTSLSCLDRLFQKANDLFFPSAFRLLQSAQHLVIPGLKAYAWVCMMLQEKANHRFIVIGDSLDKRRYLKSIRKGRVDLRSCLDQHPSGLLPVRESG